MAACRRLTAAAGVLAIVACATAAVAPPSADARRAAVVMPSQELATLLTPHQLFSTLGPAPTRVGTVGASRPITGAQTVLPVVGRRSDEDGARWLKVMVPGRPNGSRAWIRQRGTVPGSTSWHVVVRTNARRVTVYRHGRRVRSLAAIVGKPATPTPHGRFFVEESVAMPAGSAGAPYALALSARSDVLQEFAGGPGQIAIHGVGGLGGRIGTAVSHGCMRLSDRGIRWLAARVDAGTPVTITS